jgi:hypothetical protein
MSLRMLDSSLSRYPSRVPLALVGWAAALVAVVASSALVVYSPNAVPLVLLAIGMCTFAVYCLEYRAGFFLVGFFAAGIPIRLAATQFMTVSISQADIQIGLLPLFLLVALAAKHGTSPLRGWGVFYAALGAAVVFGLYIGLSHDNPNFEIFRDLGGLIPLFSFGLAIWAIQTKDEALSALWGLFAGLLAFAILMGLSACGLVPPLAREVESYWHGISRLYFHNSYLLPIFAGAAATAATVSARRRMVLLGLIGIFGLAAVVAVNRQVAFLTAAAIIGGFLLGLRLLPRERAVGDAGLVLVTMVLLALLVYPVVAPLFYAHSSSRGGYAERLAGRYVDLVQSPTMSNQGRFISVRQAAEQAKVSFPEGDGLGALFANPWSSTSYNNARYTGYQPVVDNLPLTVLVKLGLVGAAAYALLFVLIGRTARRCWKRLRAESMTRVSELRVLGLAAGVIAFPVLIVLSLGQAFMFSSEVVIALGILNAVADRLSRPDE